VLDGVPAVLPAALSAHRPLVVSTDDTLLDELLRVLAAAGAEPELATGGPALRRAHREAPLVLVGADALAAPPVRALPRRPGVVVVGRAAPTPAEWAVAVELGAERVAVLPEDEAWLLAKAAGAARAPVDRGWLAVVGGSCGGAGASTVAAALALAAAAQGEGPLLVDADPGGGGLDLLLGAEEAEGLRWPELTGLRGRVDGRALLAALAEVAGLHLLPGSRDRACRIPEEALVAVVTAARDAGHPVVVDLARGAVSGEVVLAEADLASLVVPARLRAACAARLLVDTEAAWSAAQLVVRRVPGGLTAVEVEEVVGRPVLAELPHDRAAVPRGERGLLPPVTRRSVWGGLVGRLLGELRAAQEPVR
jgi:secretion/DNA translocation related CpaE-like protein